MPNATEIAVFPQTAFDSGLQGALAKQNEFPSRRHDAGIYKISLIVVVLAFSASAVAFPWQGTMESGLNAQNFLALVNQDRSQNGVPALQINSRLQAAAEAKARDMLARGYFSHNSPGGQRPWDFIKAQGFSYTYAGENLAMNYTSPYDLENDFLHSPGHRENLLSPLFTETGIAVVSGELNGEPAIVTVQMFAAPIKTVASK